MMHRMQKMQAMQQMQQMGGVNPAMMAGRPLF